MLSGIDSTQLTAFARQFNNVALLTYLIPLSIGLRRWPTLQPVYRPLVWLVLISGCVFNGVLAELGRHVWHNNIIFLQLGTVTETLFLGWAYFHAFHSVRGRRVLLAALGLFLLTYLLEAFAIHSFSQGQDTYTHVAQSILLVAVAVAYFEQTLRELRNIALSQDPMFMVSVGTILYYAGTLMVFVLEGPLQSQPDLIWTMYIIQFILLIVLNCFYSLALWYGHRQPAPEQLPEIWPPRHL
ncbi:hypothetical protein E5K00_09870 [Hymenobacter aquaticus]|uniref:Uncharacterized protein n=1 Tax=Hymenobacter aquaticus TaxID=1867101 RepID=A0A4Z0Q724_9BACT|nr:hypothetical protein [Hymenobacter aquaticus]TGE25474.1 hypothetical protein E5K00_09870 [Hymenobacter aquaticus]